MSHTALSHLLAARHQSTAVVILQQGLITQSGSECDRAFMNHINKLGASRKRQLSVTALANGITIGCKLRLDLTFS